MTPKGRQPRTGDWFTVPLPGGDAAVGHAVRVVQGSITLTYFFTAPSDSPTLEACRELAPRDAITAQVCGGMGIRNGEWQLLGTVDVDPAEWPVPEFERRDTTRFGGDHLYLVTLDSNLSATDTVEISTEEAGLRPPDGMCGYIAAANYVQHLITSGAVPVGQQPWWQRVVGSIEPATTPAPIPHAHAVLVQIPGTWTGDLDRLLKALRRALPRGGEIDGTLRGPHHTTVYLYGPDAAGLAAAVEKATAKQHLPASATMEIRPGPPGTEAQIRRLPT